MIKDDKYFISQAIEEARNGVLASEGGPFGAVVVKEGKIIGKGNNMVLLKKDPTCHAEIEAIRNACQTLNDFQLTGCTIYSTCEPCPMCMGAIYWARPERLVFACSKEDAENAGFDDNFIYQEINVHLKERKIRTEQMERKAAMKLFDLWKSIGQKSLY